MNHYRQLRLAVDMRLMAAPQQAWRTWQHHLFFQALQSGSEHLLLQPQKLLAHIERTNQDLVQTLWTWRQVVDESTLNCCELIM